MQKALVYHNGDLIKTYEFNKSALSIGRLPVNDISINSMSISRTHLTLQHDVNSSQFLVHESKSLNGTLLNGEKVATNSPVPSLSTLVIGQYAIQLEYTSESPSGTQTIETQQAYDESEQTGTITMQQAKAAAPLIKTPQAPVAPLDTQNGLYFSGGTSTKKNTSKTAIGTLIEQSTLMEYTIAKKDITFGNAPNDDIFIEEGKLAKISVSGTSCEIKALKVMGKIVVNGAKVGQQILNDGDIIKVGKSSFTFKTI